MATIRKRTIRWTTSAGLPKSAVRYEAAYHDRSGRRHRRLFALKKDGQRWLDEQAAGTVTGQWADPRAGREMVRSYGKRWLEGQIVAASTAATYGTILSNHVLPALGDLRMDGVTRTDIQRLVKHWEASAAPRTVGARYAVAAIMFRAAVRDRVIPSTPCADIQLPKCDARSALVPISTETILALRDAMPARYRAFVAIAAGTGMRRGELLGLSIDRIAMDFGTIRVDRQLSRASRSSSPVFGLKRPRFDAASF